jgi:hypothetical protein
VLHSLAIAARRALSSYKVAAALPASRKLKNPGLLQAVMAAGGDASAVGLRDPIHVVSKARPASELALRQPFCGVLRASDCSKTRNFVLTIVSLVM